MNWRAIKASARAEIHRTFGIPVVYLTHVGATPVHVTARVHAEVAPVDMPWPHAANVIDSGPRIIFSKSELPLAMHNAYLVVDENEGYRLGAASPARDGYYEVEAVRLAESEIGPILDAVYPKPRGVGYSVVGSTFVVA